MLVITQKANEKIQIGNDITVTILRVHGRAVKVGIEAPREVRVRRNVLLAGMKSAPNGDVLLATDCGDLQPPRKPR